MRKVGIFAFAVGAVSAATLAGAASMHGQDGMHGMEAGHGHRAETAYGRPGDGAAEARQIEIVLSESDQGMHYSPDHLALDRGTEVRFVLHNEGALEHEFVIGTAATNEAHAQDMGENPDMAHADPNAARLQPGESTTLSWQFTEPGTFEYACLIPGHREAGMYGKIIVK
ncbi:plastocyanin/azurin family copper-binding protein [Afifella sp. H1R]|uniref:cupredoxin domain-containing protein n=1 Tax=Afifella sp. H1R TaxID=2908841 RepID=UPI001F1C46E0|nr:plastocyanin/azurin family copper-binding protein [Afifella sp. H1R]MCF1502515.1 plastocyanin/azurin family copper-binding protein [Afifella sp. H1R]